MMGFFEMDELKKQLAELIEKSYTKSSGSPLDAHVLFVKKERRRLPYVWTQSPPQ